MKRQEIENHQLFTNIQTYLENLETFILQENDREKSYFVGFKRSLNIILKTIEIMNDEDVSKVTLDNLNSSASQCYSQLRAFSTNGNIGHLDNYMSYVHNLNTYIATMRIYLPLDDSKIFDRVSYLRRTLTVLEKEYVEKSSQLDLSSKEIDTKVESINTKVLEVDKSINNLDTEVIKYKETINTYFNQRAEKFDTLMKEFQIDQTNQHDKKKSELDAQYKELYKEYSSIQESQINNSNKLVEKLNELVNIAGQDGARAPYSKAAKDERNASILWRSITLLSMLGFIGLSLCYALSLWNLSVTSGDIYAYISRFFVFTGLATLIGYSSKVAAKHKANHRYYRQLSLEFSSILLFMNSLSVDEQNAIKKDLTSKYYAHAENPNVVGKLSEEEVQNKFIKLLKDTASVIAELNK